MMAYADAKSTFRRPVWLFDSFEGLPEPTIEDRDKVHKKGWKIRDKSDNDLRPLGIMKADVSDVQAIMKTLNVQDQVSIIKGWFQNTVPIYKEHIGAIALLRIDADLYDSTKYSLDSLYDSVSQGGIIILDDFDSFEGSRTAVYEFFRERNISPLLRASPFGGRMYFIKKP